MKRLILTKLDECKLDWRLEHPAFVALKSAHITHIRGETKKFNFPRNLTLNIRPEGDERRDRYIMLNDGSYNLFTLIDVFKAALKKSNSNTMQ